MMPETGLALIGAPAPLDQGEADHDRQTGPHTGPDERSLMSRVLLIEDDAVYASR